MKKFFKGTVSFLKSLASEVFSFLLSMLVAFTLIAGYTVFTGSGLNMCLDIYSPDTESSCIIVKEDITEK